MLVGAGGLVSFGHAAYFGLGAYGAALTLKHFGMAAGLVSGSLAGLVGALIFGWFCVRLSGVYFAMLTLAVAQIVWSVAFQWTEVTGGDNGLLGIWPSAWAATAPHFYWLTLALVAAGIALLRVILFSPFGYALRALRDNDLRAEAIGLSRHRIEWIAFTAAGLLPPWRAHYTPFSRAAYSPMILASRYRLTRWRWSCSAAPARCPRNHRRRAL